MRWNSIATLTVIVLSATPCWAEMPQWSGDRPGQASALERGRLLGGQTWWARYGEPVNATAISQEPSKSDLNAGPMPMYGDGYAYGPGTCDCPPPCIGDLWGGYFQNPLRCQSHGGLLHKHCGACGDSCNTCGNGCGLFSRTCGKSCSAVSCTSTPSCGCATPVTCTTTADCGCKPVCGKCRHCHMGQRWRGFMAHWSCGSDSCSAPVSCGCTTPVAPMLGSEKQAWDRPPAPLPEDASLLPLPRLR